MPLLRSLKKTLVAKSPKTYWYVCPRTGDEGTSDIDFKVVKPGAPVTQRALKNEVERALSVINVLYRSEKDALKRSEAFNKLLALSQVGLVGEHASPEIAMDALRVFESDVVSREAGPVKNGYMRQLGAWALGFGTLSLCVFFFCDIFPSIPLKQFVDYRYFALLWSGCMLGTWLSFASRNVSLSFNYLIILEEDRIEPPLRLVFAGMLTTLLGLIFITGMADVTIGGFTASDIARSGVSAFLAGGFAGLSEKALPSALLARAGEIVPAKS